MQTRQRSSVFYRPELDILRFCAFLMVFFCHAISWNSKIVQIGARGVDLFFVISAYLITELLLREKRITGAISVPHFYLRRILRIWPLYFTFLFLCFIAEKRWTLQAAIPFLCFFANLRHALPSIPVFGTAAGILWSVSLEEQFYLSWPLLLRTSRRFHIPACLALLATGILSRWLMFHFHVSNNLIGGSTLSRIDAIAVGALIAFVLDGTVGNRGRVFGYTLLVISVGCLAANASLRTVSGTTVVALSSGGILLSFMYLQFRNAILEYLGRISYGLYVFHLAALKYATALRVPWGVRFAVAFLITVAAATISYYWLERPFLHLKDRFAVVHKENTISSELAEGENSGGKQVTVQ